MTDVRYPDSDAAPLDVAVGARPLGVASTSARSALLTILGEFVGPRRQAVWTSTLLRALAAIGVEHKAARQAISRMAQEGLLESERSGRRVRWSLTERGATLLRDGADRIYGFLREDRSWDGRWLVVNVAVPEVQRSLRHRLRTQLTWLGMGSPAPGLWVIPDADKEGAVLGVLEELGLRSNAFAWIGSWVPVEDVQSLISAAWTLDELAAQYRDFTTWVAGMAPLTPAETFVAQVALVHEWRRFPFLDPVLPASLLPSDWPATCAVDAFIEGHARWHDAAQAQWEAWAAEEAG
ncbi:PaaX family transcriptional regulator C-terminal domain-containing protein [Rhodococcus sp. NPDC127530]|uniref:PaaX family transcriptional regulator n=1 Tax=unclassified Rhodococcus (in: high G+C Gram-positive bacteria) TaxID=192944 RepID=UPI00363300E7